MKSESKTTSIFPLIIKLPIIIVVVIQMGCVDANKNHGHSTESMPESFEALHDSKKSTAQRGNGSNDVQIDKDTTNLTKAKMVARRTGKRANLYNRKIELKKERCAL